MNFSELLIWHKEHYPHMQAEDVVKLVFQSIRGCGHLLADEVSVARRIESECSALSPAADEPLTEPLGDRYIRLHLRRAMAEGVRPLWIARMMRMSCEADAPGSVADVLAVLNEMLADHEAVMHAAAPLTANASWLPSHSAIYHEHYAPAYRVIDKRFLQTLPLLCALGKTDKPQVLIGIDGRCGSGKSTLAAMLSSILDAPVVHMDDFFTPHSKKTPERLSLPGGNADVERFTSEFLQPWLRDGHASYRPYSCHEDVMLEAIDVPASAFVIVEGSYCMHPDTGRPYDVSAFMTIPYEEQCERILTRSGEYMLNRFKNEWIPLEEKYFEAFRLPDERCIVIDQPVQTVS